jgi:hypothetical protein
MVIPSSHHHINFLFGTASIKKNHDLNADPHAGRQVGPVSKNVTIPASCSGTTLNVVDIHYAMWFSGWRGGRFGSGG